MKPPQTTRAAPVDLPRISSGVEGLDTVLHGGLTGNRVYLIEGSPGTGKTTFALQFLQAGVRNGERALYITLSETRDELEAVVASHGWTLEGIDVFELHDEAARDPASEQSILYPSEIELGETVGRITAEIARGQHDRIVFDSLSEMRLLAQDPLRYRRQVLALKQFFSTRQCTVLLVDDKTSADGDLQLHSICHGVISLQQETRDYGSESRRLRVVKMRGQKFHGGVHDYVLDTGRVSVFPRLIAADYRRAITHERIASGNTVLDAMLGGGLTRGASTLLLGPSGIGKTTTVISCMLAALQRGERAVYYLFDESQSIFLLRSKALGVNLQPYIDSEHCRVVQIDPADLSTGEFSALVVDAVTKQGASFVALDSLNAYLQAMPGQSYLLLHMHELLTFLTHQGVTTMLVVGQHGAIGNVRADIDMSYLSDTTLLFGYFEAQGAVRSAITALKSRVGRNERTIREFRITPGTVLEIGEPLVAFEGVLTGLPTYSGASPMLAGDGR